MRPYGRPMQRNGWFLIFALIVGCRPSTRATPVDRTLLYAAALDAPGLLRGRRGLALEPHLMSDSGTYEASGLLSDAIVRFLRDHRTVVEVCKPVDSEDQVPSCGADSAGVELRVSRPVPLGDTAFVIFVGQGNIRARNDTTRLQIPFATTHACRVARQGSTWHLRKCDLHMIT